MGERATEKSSTLVALKSSLKLGLIWLIDNIAITHKKSEISDYVNLQHCSSSIMLSGF